jgi:serine/threonine protein kinase
MASVWVARLSGKHGFEKLVAIKTILPKLAADPRFRRMFVDEACIAARIDHPNVAQVFDLGEERGVPYLVMEYVDGDSLSKLNRACQKRGVSIPASVILRVLADACAGLHDAHELKGEGGRALSIVHRDISPHNVLCSTRGVVKLIDFGIAKTDSGDAASAESGVLKGKIQYMAPEQALGRPVDRRADLWGVGAILYHLLAGKAPYEGDSQLAMLHMLGSGVPPRPLPSEVHPAIAALARKALALDPAKRYATAADLRDAIERTMVMAQLTATAADVAAFSMQHLADRAQRRRDAIDRALAASSKRVRAEEATGDTLAGVQRASSDAIADALRPPFDVRPDAALPASEPPAGATSYATLGSSALVASAPIAGPTRPRRSTLGALALGAGIAAAAAISVGLSRPGRHVGGGPALAAGTAPPTAETAIGPPPAAIEAPVVTSFPSNPLVPDIASFASIASFSSAASSTAAFASTAAPPDSSGVVQPPAPDAPATPPAVKRKKTRAVPSPPEGR